MVLVNEMTRRRSNPRYPESNLSIKICSNKSNGGYNFIISEDQGAAGIIEAVYRTLTYIIL
jgi:hypothetical protein